MLELGRSQSQYQLQLNILFWVLSRHLVSRSLEINALCDIVKRGVSSAEVGGPNRPRYVERIRR